MNDIEALYQTAMKEHQAGRVAAAEAIYRQILDRDRLFARAWYLLGVALHQQGDTPTAIEYVERAIGLEPQWPLFYANLGSIYAAVGRMRDAERMLRHAIAIAPRLAMALGGLA